MGKKYFLFSISSSCSCAGYSWVHTFRSGEDEAVLLSDLFYCKEQVRSPVPLWGECSGPASGTCATAQVRKTPSFVCSDCQCTIFGFKSLLCGGHDTLVWKKGTSVLVLRRDLNIKRICILSLSYLSSPRHLQVLSLHDTRRKEEIRNGAA